MIFKLLQVLLTAKQMLIYKNFKLKHFGILKNVILYSIESIPFKI